MKKIICLSTILLFLTSCDWYTTTNSKEYNFNPSGNIEGHDYVDLGLSVKWATYNIGANDIDDYGEFFAWGETTPYHEQLTWINYEWTHSPCSPDQILSSIYDAATVNWGRSWRMPTNEELDELINKCNWEWEENFNNTSIAGYIVSSKKNSNAIFLPASKFISHDDKKIPQATDGYYWSSWIMSLAGKYAFNRGTGAGCLQFVDMNKGWTYPAQFSFWTMGDGAVIRPVVGIPNDYYPNKDTMTIDEEETTRQGITVSGTIGTHTYVDLGLPSRTLWATYNVGAAMPGEYGHYYAWGETSPKSLYDMENYIFFDKFAEDGPYHYAQLTKYIYNKEYGIPDAKYILDSEDDAATINFGARWCMPTKKQIEELGEYCIFYRKDIVVNGKKIIGYIGESKINGHKIYIPAAGWEYATTTNNHMYMWYWTSELYDKNNYWAYFMRYDDKINTIVCDDGTSRYNGLPVRAVVKQ